MALAPACCPAMSGAGRCRAPTAKPVRQARVQTLWTPEGVEREMLELGIAGGPKRAENRSYTSIVTDALYAARQTRRKRPIFAGACVRDRPLSATGEAVPKA